jgi:hypothetical protein
MFTLSREDSPSSSTTQSKKGSTMSTAAQIDANRINAESSTGPRTEAGKATSSQNAVSHGLFATRDFIRPGEEEAYSELDSMAEEQFSPRGLLECTLVDEIVRAMWRLRRCGQIEASFVNALATESGPILDPMQNEAIARLQNSVDRARAQSHRLLHRCTQELRRLQTERHYRNETTEAGTDLTYLGLSDFRAVKKGAAENKMASLRQRRQEVNDQFDYLKRSFELSNSESDDAESDDTDPDDTDSDGVALDLDEMPLAQTPLTERTQSSRPRTVEIARNAPCPCNSGKKYKRCCGVNAPALCNAA